MITNDKGIVELKHFILREVCRLAWEGQLTEEETEKIVYQVSPGPKPQYRCCVYKEREIVRGRIRLAMGQDPDPVPWQAGSGPGQSPVLYKHSSGTAVWALGSPDKQFSPSPLRSAALPRQDGKPPAG